MDDLLPAILTEDTIPLENRSCEKCELSTHGTRIIWGEGNTAAPIFVVLDNPGAREDKDKRPFLCGTRKTLQKAVHEAGLNINSLYVTYILKCQPRRAYDKATAKASCIKYLWGQLDAINPDIIMCLGNVACQSFFEDPSAEAKALRGKVNVVRNYRTIVSYHPLAVRRRPVLYKYFLEDWKLVASQLH